MNLRWIAENPPRWDAAKAAVLADAPEGVFDGRSYRPGDLLPAEWWRVEDDKGVVGYGWLEASWGDAEIMLAVDPTRRGSGVGGFILDRLHDEARARGLNYLHNVIPAGHADPEKLARWLAARGFAQSGEGRLRRAVTRREKKQL